MQKREYKTKIVNIRLSESEFQSLKRKAMRSGLTHSEFIRRAANNRRIVSRIEESAINELRRLGGLLKHIHLESAGAYSRATAAAIDEIRKAVRKLEIYDR